MDRFAKIFDSIPPKLRSAFTERALSELEKIANDLTGGNQMTQGNTALKKYGLDLNNPAHLGAYIARFESLPESTPDRHNEAARLAAKDVHQAGLLEEWERTGHTPRGIDLLMLDREPRTQLPEPDDNPKTGFDKINKHFKELK